MEETRNKIVPLVVGILFVILVIATLITGYVYFNRRGNNKNTQAKTPNQQVQGAEDTAVINNTRSNDLLAQTQKTTVTPAIGQQVDFNITQEKGGVGSDNQQKGGVATQIPKTGIGITFLPAVLSGLFAGVYINKKTKSS